eukprot:TRINITY_DN533_c0_g3_i1.p1 TRINITY_DN533_c0_g3~~TRINITY_DN533_c0_g3_i1.p1  ORF type:complete len:653 (+),score=110.78 TRINITY_DN533_c0_g3_i1:88-2046(+)
MAKLFVGQLPFAFTEDQLLQLVQPYGHVIEAVILVQRETGRSKGCGFVTFSTDEEAQTAVNALHEKIKLPGAPDSLQLKPALSSGGPRGIDVGRMGVSGGPPQRVAPSELAIPPGTHKGGRKVFVLGLPIPTSEDAVRAFLGRIGPIEEVFFITERENKDRQRGAALVTYAARIYADRALEYFATPQMMDGSRAQIQMKRAQGEPDGPLPPPKLFVGRLSDEVEAADLRELFGQYGEVEDVVVLKDRATGRSKRAAFVKYRTHEEADHAIQEVHQKIMVTGQTVALEVRYADPPKQARGRPAGSIGPATTVGLGNGFHMPVGALRGVNGAFGGGSHLPQPLGGVMTGMVGSPSASTDVGSYGGYGSQPIYGTVGNVPVSGNANHHSGSPTDPQQQVMLQMMAVMQSMLPQQQQGMTSQATSPMTSMDVPTSADSPAFPGAVMRAIGGVPQAVPQHANGWGGSGAVPRMATGTIGREKRQGPFGANLIVEGLPWDVSETQLENTFAPYGRVLSVHVFVDRATGQSKGFGFVSFETPQMAQTAIAALHDSVLGNRRIRVSLKKSEMTAAQPYVGAPQLPQPYAVPGQVPRADAQRLSSDTQQMSSFDSVAQQVQHMHAQRHGDMPYVHQEQSQMPQLHQMQYAPVAQESVAPVE